MVGHAEQRDAGLVAGVRDGGDQGAFHRLLFSDHEGTGRLRERGPAVDSNRVVTRVLDAAQLQDAGAGCRHLEHLLERDHGQLARIRHDPRVGAVDAGHVGVDLAHLGVYRGGERDGGRIAPAAAQRRHVTGRRDALKAGHEHDQVVVERGPDAVRADVEDPRLGVAGVRHDPGLGAGEADRVVAQVVDRHRAQRAADALAGGQQHVHLARIGAGRDLFGHRDELVGGLPACREHRDDAMALLTGGDDAPRGALDALRIGHGGPAELHHHGAGHGGQV
jgi:hypothetical protein